jgi:predicted kinase
VSKTGPAGGPARVVLITGEPGSGKTTLGLELARTIRVPFIARDDVRAGLFFTAGGWSAKPTGVPTAQHAVETFLRIVENVAGLGVSCVVEYVVRRGQADDLRRIEAVADCVVLHTWCADALERFVRRNTADPLVNRQPVLDALGYETIRDHTAAAAERMRSVAREMRRDFDLPVMSVNTDDGYNPDMGQIVDFVVGTPSRR